jgi:hypothetical protein
LFVDDTQIERRQTPTLDLGVVSNNGFHSRHSGCNSVRVFPGTIPAEFEFRSKFRRNCLMNLAGPYAKFDSSGIPGIAQIPPDSGRNQWGTVKTLPD